MGTPAEDRADALKEALNEANLIDMLKGAPRVDGWRNLFTGLGTERDVSGANEYVGRARCGVATLDRLYEQNSLAANIMDWPAFDATREWIELSQHNEERGDVEEELDSALLDLGAKQACQKAIAWARLYGGAVILVGADDGSELDQPLNEAAIRTVRKLDVIDRFQLQSGDITDDIKDENYGLPETYTLNPAGLPASRGRGGLSTVIHHTRLLRFNGIEVSDRLRAENQGWGISVMNRVYDEIRDYGASRAYLPTILKEGAIDVFQIDNLKELLASGKEEQIRTRFRLIAMCKSILGGIVLGKEESYDKKIANLQGHVELFAELKEAVSAASGIPQTFLFGRSPAGLNATGESDIRIYYDKIASYQEAHLLKPLRRLVRLIALAKEGPIRRDVDVDVKFCPLWQLSDTEKATNYGVRATADCAYVAGGVLTEREVALSRFGGNEGEIQIDEQLRREEGLMLDEIRMQSDIEIAKQGPTLARKQAEARQQGPAAGKPPAPKPKE